MLAWYLAIFSPSVHLTKPRPPIIVRSCADPVLNGPEGVDTVAGAVGPLYYCNVNIAGEPVEAMVDTGSSATIMSFDLFKKIGRKAGIAMGALSQPDVTLRDYSQRPIPVGAKVDLEGEFNGKKMTATVYLRGSGSTESESLLLGTNVVITLGLMSPL